MATIKELNFNPDAFFGLKFPLEYKSDDGGFFPRARTLREQAFSNLKNWKKFQSFPSGHVSSTYISLLLLEKDFLMHKFITYILIFLIIIARINNGAHYFSDCMYAIFFVNCYTYRQLV